MRVVFSLADGLANPFPILKRHLGSRAARVVRWGDRLAIAAMLGVPVLLMAAWWVEPALSAQGRLASWWAAIAFYMRTFQPAIGVMLVGLSVAPLVARHRRRAVLLVLVGLAVAVPEVARLVRPATAARADVVQGTPVSVFSMNLWRGNTQMRSVLEQVEAERPDFVCFQEYTVDHERVLGPALQSAYPYRITFASWGYQGLAIYAKRPITIELAPEVNTFHWRWMAVRATIDGREVRIVCLHPTSPFLPDRIRTNRNEIDWMIKNYLDPSRPTILAGDCNWSLASQQATAIESAGFTAAERVGGAGLGYTWGPQRGGPSVVAIDHVFASSHFAVSSHRVLAFAGSDHRPILSRLILRP